MNLLRIPFPLHIFGRLPIDPIDHRVQWFTPLTFLLFIWTSFIYVYFKKAARDEYEEFRVSKRAKKHDQN